MNDRIEIPGNRYLWAIQRAGLTLEGYVANHPKSDICNWISGIKKPTIKQLENFSGSVDVPFGYLFLDQLPHEEIPFPVFRGTAGTNDHFNLNVYDTVMSVKQRQEWLVEYLSENEMDESALVDIISIDTPIYKAVNLLRQILSLEPSWAFCGTNTDYAVNTLTERLENAGVFLVYNGVVGNNTYRPIDVNECRGFALVNNIAPFIFINNSDSKTAQVFTLIHEATHLMIGVSAGHAGEEITSDNATETYCDKVAAEFLVPELQLKGIWNNDIKAAARKFKVSEIVIARRALDLNLINRQTFVAFLNDYRNRPLLERQSKGGNFYLTSVKRVGKLFAIHVRNAVNSNQLSYIEAYRLTGLYGQTYNKFMNNNI